LARGETVRIFTGAPVPSGTDGIAMQEDVTRDGEHVVLNVDVEKGEFIRRRACDLADGQEIVARGQRITPTVAALLASQGFAEVNVGGRVQASVISTGDEIVGPGQKLQSGQIYDSNSVLIAGLLDGIGASVVSAMRCADHESALTASIKEASAHRVLVLTGGVSVGEHDLVQSVIRSLGGRIEIWRVAVKPGKPFLFGHIDECAIFGLPGNPVSAFVTFLKFVRPGILKMMGANAGEQGLRGMPARLTEDLANDGDRVHYMRGRYEDGTFVPVGRQESHALFGLSRANAIARLAPRTRLRSGSTLNVELWD
jgi:molybdopterin molybdotransferase